MPHTAETYSLLDYYNKVFVYTDCFIVTYCPSVFNIYTYRYLNAIFYNPYTKGHTVRRRMAIFFDTFQAAQQRRE